MPIPAFPKISDTLRCFLVSQHLIAVTPGRRPGEGLASSSLLTPAKPDPEASLGDPKLMALARDWPPRLQPLPSGKLGGRREAEQHVPVSSSIIRKDECQENMV